MWRLVWQAVWGPTNQPPEGDDDDDPEPPDNQNNTGDGNPQREQPRDDDPPDGSGPPGTPANLQATTEELEEEETTQPLLDDEANQVVSVEQRSFSLEQQLAEVPAEVPKPLPKPFISLPQVRVPETRSLSPRGSRVISQVPWTSQPDEAHEGVREEEELVSVVSTGTGMERPRSLLRGRATVNIEEISSVVEGSLSASGHLMPGRKCTSEVQFTLAPPQKIARPTSEMRILGSKVATIPVDPMTEPTVTLFTTTSDTPHSTGLSLATVAALASRPTTTPQQGGVRLSHGLDLPLSGNLTVTPHGGLVVSQVCRTTRESGGPLLMSGRVSTSTAGVQILSMRSASVSMLGSSCTTMRGMARHVPATTREGPDNAEEIVIDDEEEELEDVDKDEDDDLPPSQLLQRATSCKKREDNEGDDEDYDPTGYKKSDMIRFLCIPLYSQDSEGAQEVWGRILGLGQGLKPTKRQINHSP